MCWACLDPRAPVVLIIAAMERRTFAHKSSLRETHAHLLGVNKRLFIHTGHFLTGFEPRCGSLDTLIMASLHKMK